MISHNHLDSLKAKYLPMHAVDFSKLKLEHVVIEKGQFHQERTKPASMDEIEVCILAVDL